MTRKLAIIIVAVVLGLGALSAGIAYASGAVGGDDDKPLSGDCAPEGHRRGARVHGRR